MKSSTPSQNRTMREGWTMDWIRAHSQGARPDRHKNFSEPGRKKGRQATSGTRVGDLACHPARHKTCCRNARDPRSLKHLKRD
ncbi:hypothetical protein Ddc_07960 [Ditylenchus destructor]|nr:hypothetical protein Ddc_07960 [Ditylenchus destructor]